MPGGRSDRAAELGTRVGFPLAPHQRGTQTRIRQTGWPKSNEQFRISSSCWAMYLWLLRREVEEGEVVPYERRLDV